jgi:hypothetical protein
MTIWLIFGSKSGSKKVLVRPPSADEDVRATADREVGVIPRRRYSPKNIMR